MKRAMLWLSLGALAGCATSSKTAAPATPPAEAHAQAAQPADGEPWREKAPAPGAAPELVVPKFVKQVLPNGLTVMVSEEHSLPLVGLAVATGAGTAADPKGKAGLAALTYDMLLQGAGPYDAVALDEQFAKLGGSAFAVTRPDGAMVGTRVLSSSAVEATRLLSQVVLKPRFEKAEFERQKGRRLATLALSVGSPEYLLNEALGQTLYGADHPYARPGSGTPESVEKLTLEDLRAFYKANLGPKDAVFIATGDVTLDQAVAWAKQAFGSWKAPAVRPPAPPDVPERPRQLVMVPKNGLGQTVIAVGRPAVRAQSEEVAPLELASTVFGGFFGSRLNMNLREAKGYSYGANAYLDARRGEGPVIATSAVRADVTGPSLKEFINELEGIKQRPIQPKELEAAREGLIRSLPGSFTTVGDLLESAAGLYWEEKPLDYYGRLVEDLKQATPAQVQAAAEKYFDPKGVDVVMVGDPQTVKSQVAPLDLGTLTVHEPPRPPKGVPQPQPPASRPEVGEAR